MDRRVMLKVKIKSLAAEAAIIRAEERKRGPHRLALAAHRRGVVRTEARSTLLAYAYVRGRPYCSLECRARTRPDWTAVERMVRRYGEPGATEGLAAWKPTA